jgi:hypothetical protein
MEPANLTKKDYDVLLSLRRKPLTFRQILVKHNIKEEALNQILSSQLKKLVRTVGDEEGNFSIDPLTLTYWGETYAQAEFDRRFDRYYTRVASLIAIVTSIAAIAVSLKGSC